MDTDALTDEERAELESLRAEKAAREESARLAAERAELEALRQEQAAAEAAEARAKAEADAAAARAADAERARQMMEPDDDLKMAPGQKMVFIAIIVVAVAWGLITFLG